MGNTTRAKRLATSTLLLLLALFALLVACSNGRAGESGSGSMQSGQVVSAQQPSATPTAGARATHSVPPTFTPIPTITLTPSPGPSATPTQTFTPSPVPSSTPAPSATPTSRPQANGGLSFYGTPPAYLTATPVTPVPTPVPTFEVPSSVTNILLLGSDVPLDQGIGRSDTIIIASVDRDAKTASMISLPRDLYVYIPGVKMNRINTAITYGADTYPGGSIGVLKDTILYNFGVPIHYYARVDFAGFPQVVDAVGGVDIAVSCPYEDFRLKSPESRPEDKASWFFSDTLDEQDEENWELYRVDPGIRHMDGQMALWYARSRDNREADFGRTKRQQQVLRAIFNKGLSLDMISQVPTLYNTYRDTVDTDLDIGRILQLAAIAPAVQQNGIQHLYISPRDIESWVPPGEGAGALLPKWDDQLEETFYRLFSPPSLNSGLREPVYVEVVNASGNPDMALLAADNLRWQGLVPVLSDEAPETQETTTISYYADNFKSSFDWLVSWIFGKRQGDIELVPNTAYDYDYRVVLGADYDPCVNQLYAPREFLN